MFRLLIILAVVVFWVALIAQVNEDRAALKQYQACMARSDTTLDDCLPTE